LALPEPAVGFNFKQLHVFTLRWETVSVAEGGKAERGVGQHRLHLLIARLSRRGSEKAKGRWKRKFGEEKGKKLDVMWVQVNAERFDKSRRGTYPLPTSEQKRG